MTRKVTSRPGLSAEEAMESLQRMAHTGGEMIVGLPRLHEGRWVAMLKQAEFPPKDEGSEGPPSPEEDAEADVAEDGPPKPKGDEDDDGDFDGDSGGPDGPPGASEGGPEGKPKGGEHEVLNLLHQIVQGLQAAGLIQPPVHDKLAPGGEPMPPGPPGPGGPEGPGAGGPPGGSMGKDPGHLPSKLGPGDVLPHQTPIGAPAFASVAGVMPGGLSPMGPDMNAGHVPNPSAQMANPPCSKCGQPTVNGICPSCVSTGPAGGAMGQQLHASAPREMEIQTGDRISALQAHREIIAEFGPKGYEYDQLVSLANGGWKAKLVKVR